MLFYFQVYSKVIHVYIWMWFIDTYMNVFIYIRIYGFPGDSVVSNSPAKAGDTGLISGWGRSPGEGKPTYSSILVWEISWTEEPGRLQFMGSQRVGYDLVTKQQQNYIYIYIDTHTHIYVCVCLLFHILFRYVIKGHWVELPVLYDRSL